VSSSSQPEHHAGYVDRKSEDDLERCEVLQLPPLNQNADAKDTLKRRFPKQS
jgi:hypothetical protein